MIVLKIALADNVVQALKKEADKRGKISITKCGYQIIKEHLRITEEVDAR